MRRVSRQQRLRHRLIADWRGVEAGPLIDEPPKTLGELIPGVLKGWKLDGSVHTEEVSAAWQEMVGEFISKHTAPDGLKRAVLTVRVLQPAIHHALMAEKPKLLARLQARFGAVVVKDIKFRHG